MTRSAWFAAAAFAFVVVTILGACSDGDTLIPGEPSDSGDESTTCANVGCSAPPPCGEACTAPCGCCPNLACVEDASADGAIDASDLDARSDAGDPDADTLDGSTDGA